MNRLDSALATLDELTVKDRNFPSELAAIEAKHEALTNQELDSVEAIQSRSAEMSKIVAMRELAVTRQMKLKNAITAQEKLVIETGTRAARLVEELWWNLHKEAFAQAETEFNRMFFRAHEWPDVLNKYRPLVLLEWLKPPDVLRTTAFDIKITRFRALRASADRLREFERMTFQEISDELEALDRESRESRYRKPAGYPVVAT